MTRETTHIDLNSGPDLPSLIREAARRRQRVVLRDNNSDVTILSLAAPKRRLEGKRPTKADIEAALATFGSWKSHINAEQFKRDIKAARSDHRPPVRL